ncbi:hypothetical protein JOB18_016753 [Solea senegalensis]|uniref:Uncharacterized protein n=1 Tax=Solea senegalensis TaxID=28829 RepID=A0AAV6RH54_SOLSE|nr:hypothetical protein JOB18_016753 [Solea senegalensis]
MCTTMMVLTSVALILRQMFSNKVQPQKETTETAINSEHDLLPKRFTSVDMKGEISRHSFVVFSH